MAFTVDKTIAGVPRASFFILFCAGAIFFLLYQFLYGATALRDLANRESAYIISNQPDEASNYFFIRQLVFEKSVGRDIAYREHGHSQVHPRSMTVVNDTLVPIGFPFYIMIIAALVSGGGVFGGSSWFNLLAISITPLIAVAAAFLVYGLLRRLWSERVALLSSLLLFVLPPWWYYASRPFQHTIMFFAAVLLALYGLVRWSETESDKRMGFAVLSALGIACALAIRPSELIWVTALYVYMFFVLRMRPQAREVISWIAVGVIVGGLFFCANTLWYGNPLASGYVKPLPTGEAPSVLGGGQGVPFLRAFLFPFGINIIAAAKTAYQYILVLFFPLALLATGGGVYAWIKNMGYARRYIYAYIVLSAYLIIFYGSWSFTDNLLGLPSIGSSQARYLMPVYLGALPLLAFALDAFCEKVPKRILSYVGTACVLLFFGIGLRSTVFSFPEGLNAIQSTVNQYRTYQNLIEETIPQNSVVVTRYGDKYLFPHWEVIVRSSEQELWLGAIENLLNEEVPVYWHDLALFEKEYEQINELFQERGMELGAAIANWDGLDLREIRLKTESNSRTIE